MTKDKLYMKMAIMLYTGSENPDQPLMPFTKSTDSAEIINKQRRPSDLGLHCSYTI